MSKARGKTSTKKPVKDSSLSQVLASKEATKFRNAIKLYDDRQYKAGYRLAEAILKVSPKNGDANALAGLFLYHLGRPDEAASQFQKAQEYGPNSHYVWQFTGIYNRDRKKYDLALENFAAALKIEPFNSNIIRDLAPLYLQGRKYPEAVVYRKKALENAAGYRMSWTGSAAAQYLNHQYAEAEATLKKFLDAVKNTTFPKTDTEHTEAALFENRCIYKQGDVQRALDHINSLEEKICDPLSIMEFRAQYLLELGKFKEAQREYRALVKRNPDNLFYYKQLELALQIDPSDLKTRKMVYNYLATKYPRSDVIPSILMEILSGEEFKTVATSYLKTKIFKGVPSTFVLVKPLYENSEKRDIIKEIIVSLKEDIAGKQQSILWANFFLAQHFNTLGDYNTALEYIEKCIEESSTILEFYLIKARILKHMGDFKGAAKVANSAREMDLSDRFVNCKTVKYLLRADEYQEAIRIASIFTRNDSTNVGIKDMHDMETLWTLIEQLEYQYRAGRIPLALKRCEAIFDIFDTIYVDQFDFHSFSMRKGSVLSYIEMMEFEDSLYSHPVYIRALEIAKELYFLADDERQSIKQLTARVEETADDNSQKKELQQELSKLQQPSALKRATEKEYLDKQIAQLQEDCTRDTKLREAEMPPKPVKNGTANTKEKEFVDKDPWGYEFWDSLLEKDGVALEKLSQRWEKLNASAPHLLKTWDVGFDLYLRQKKYVMAVQIINSKIKAVQPAEEVTDNWVAQHAVRIKKSLLCSEENVPPAIKLLVDRTLNYPGLKEAAEKGDAELLKFYKDKVLSVSSPDVYTYISGLASFYPNSKSTDYFSEIERVLFEKLENNKLVKETVEDLRLLEHVGDVKGAEEYKSKAKKKWPRATCF